MVFRDALGTAHDSYLGLSAADEVGTKDDGVGSRRAGCGDAGSEGEQRTVAAGYHVGGGSAVVGADIVVVRVVVEKVGIVLLALVHAAHGGAADEGDGASGAYRTYGAYGVHRARKPGFLQGLVHSEHAQQGGARSGFGADAEALFHLVVAQLHLAYGKLRVGGFQVVEWGNARALFAERLERCCLSNADGRHDAGTCNHYPHFTLHFSLFTSEALITSFGWPR